MIKRKMILGIAIMVVIAAGFSACISISSAPPPSEEELAYRETLENASWNVERLAGQPSLNGFVNVVKFGYTDSEWAENTEVAYFQSAKGEGEKARGRTITSEKNGTQGSFKLLGLDNSTWYRLTAPELPGRIFYYYMDMPANAILGKLSLYKNQQ